MTKIPGANKSTLILVVINIALLAVVYSLQSEKTTEPGKMQYISNRLNDNNQSAGMPEPGASATGLLCFVIDDAGNSLDQLQPFLELPFPITIAVMPQREFTYTSGQLIKTSGKTLVLHQPMEPLSESASPGPGTITTSMSDEQIRQTLEENIKELPGLVGVNNHMGSKATSDLDVMTTVSSILDGMGLLFLDSRTSPDSVANVTAEQLGLPYLARNSIFLDNTKNREDILDAMNKGLEVAGEKGYALMIGHVQTPVIAEILTEQAPIWEGQGFRLVDMPAINSHLLRINSDINNVGIGD